MIWVSPPQITSVTFLRRKQVSILLYSENRKPLKIQVLTVFFTFLFVHGMPSFRKT